MTNTAYVMYVILFDVNRFYPKTQLSWLARLDHSHCNSADPLTDGLEVCCVFYRPGPIPQLFNHKKKSRALEPRPGVRPLRDRAVRLAAARTFEG